MRSGGARLRRTMVTYSAAMNISIMVMARVGAQCPRVRAKLGG